MAIDDDRQLVQDILNDLRGEAEFHLAELPGLFQDEPREDGTTGPAIADATASGVARRLGEVLLTFVEQLEALETALYADLSPPAMTPELWERAAGYYSQYPDFTGYQFAARGATPEQLDCTPQGLHEMATCLAPRAESWDADIAQIARVGGVDPERLAAVLRPAGGSE